MDPSETTESDRAKLVRRSFAQHRLAVEVQGSTLRKNSSSCRCEPVDLDVTTTPKSAARLWQGANISILRQSSKMPLSIRS